MISQEDCYEPSVKYNDVQWNVTVSPGVWTLPICLLILRHSIDILMLKLLWPSWYVKVDMSLWPEATKEKLDAKADLSEVAKAAKLRKSYCPIASNRSAECLDKINLIFGCFVIFLLCIWAPTMSVSGCRHEALTFSSLPLWTSEAPRAGVRGTSGNSGEIDRNPRQVCCEQRWYHQAP